MPRRLALLCLALLGAGLGCRAAGQFLSDLLKERPPAPLEQADLASDIRIDSAGQILGSFVGEGTSRQVHLLSSDTGFIAALVRRYRPVSGRRIETWGWLAGQRIYAVNLSDATDSALTRQIALVGSPTGHTPVRIRTLLLIGSRCGWRGARAELIVDDPRGGGPSLRGPVVGSLRTPDDSRAVSREFRTDLPPPSELLLSQLLGRTGDAMDSLINRRLGSRDGPLSRPDPVNLAVNSLEDIDAADVLPFRLDDGRVRYAVSLRARRRTATGADVLAATVMVWDSTGAWQQVVFSPTLIDLNRGRLTPRRGSWAPVFWRRLEPVSGFAFERDYLWMEQVDVDDASVRWTILEPRGNTVVAAAEVDGPCS